MELFKVNFMERDRTFIGCIRIVLVLLAILCTSILLPGCADKVRELSTEQLTEFEKAGPTTPVVDTDRLVRARIAGGPYHVATGEVLELTMPTILQLITAQEPAISDSSAPYICRISRTGTISLPVVGQIEVLGKSPAEIEQAVIDAYYPRYSKTHPSVFARVIEYKTAGVSIVGAVEKPGVYNLRQNKMSLIGLLMEAGGIVDQGAAVIRISRIADANSNIKQQTDIDHADVREILVEISFSQNDPLSTTGELTAQYQGRVLLVEKLDVASSVQRHAFIERLIHTESGVSESFVEEMLKQLAEQLQPGVEGVQSTSNAGSPKTDDSNRKATDCETDRCIVLPVKGLNIPFADVALADGDAVTVERLEMPVVTVVGLVNRPGNFPYPPDARYSLMQAIAFAGGLNLIAGPRYATIYRLRSDGSIARAPFKIIESKNPERLTDAANMQIKPGDIIAVEQTQRTRTNLFLDRTFRLSIGTYLRMDDMFNGD